MWLLHMFFYQNTILKNLRITKRKKKKQFWKWSSRIIQCYHMLAIPLRTLSKLQAPVSNILTFDKKKTKQNKNKKFNQRDQQEYLIKLHTIKTILALCWYNTEHTVFRIHNSLFYIILQKHYYIQYFKNAMHNMHSSTRVYLSDTTWYHRYSTTFKKKLKKEQKRNL